LYSPSLGYEEFGSVEVFGIHTIFVEPRVSCKVVAETKFYFDEISISVYHNSSEITPIVAHYYTWEMEPIEFEFPVLSGCMLDELSTVSDVNDVLDYNSIQGQAAAWVDVEASDLSLCGTEFLLQLYALATINFSFDGTTKENGLSWLSSTNACKWSGIFCDHTGSVSVIFLVNEGLTGRIPGEISLLTDLEIINFAINDINGTIPSELGNLSKLTDFTCSNPHHQTLSGSLPTELGNLISLKTLDLTDNALTGTLPMQLGNLSRLTSLTFQGNDLSGPIPTAVGNLQNLELLFFDDNDLTGTLPTELGKLGKLGNLKLDQNKLTGFVPREVTSIGSLEKFSIEGNNLTCYEDDLLCLSLVG